MSLSREQVAKRAARELSDGDHVALGPGISALVAHHLPAGVRVTFESDLSAGAGATATAERERAQGAAPVRAGPVDVAIVDAVQVSERGDLASLTADFSTLLECARRVVALLEHADEHGTPTIVARCTLPLAGRNVVHRIITDLATIDVTSDGLVVREVAPGTSARAVQEVTEPTLKVASDLSVMLG